MAGFEGTHSAPLGEAVREWRLGKFAPLYAAGILAGLGIGLSIATWPADSPEVRAHIPAAAASGMPAIMDEPPAFALPALPAYMVNPATTVDLPLEWYPQMEPPPVVVEAPVPVAAAPAAPAPAPVVPVAQAPAPQPVAPAAPAQAAPAPPPAPPARPNFYVPEVSGGPATTMELHLLELINAERAAAGMAPYTLDSGLTRIARTRSQQLIDQNYFAHRDPFGYSMYVELLKHFGYNYYAWAGENLAMNNWPVDTAANEAIKGLMASPTHRANILAGDFSRIGVGEISTADGRHFFTMIFLG
jgi:uncharacterized protein YkwD